MFLYCEVVNAFVPTRIHVHILIYNAHFNEMWKSTRKMFKIFTKKISKCARERERERKKQINISSELIKIMDD